MKLKTLYLGRAILWGLSVQPIKYKPDSPGTNGTKKHLTAH